MAKNTGFIDFSESAGDEDWWRTPALSGGRDDAPTYHSCYVGHPALKLGKGTLIGGNCRDHDKHEGIDLYVALDGSMKHPEFKAGEKLARCTYYPITNMSVPQRPDKFETLIDTLVSALNAGATVHVGCIGGHGRTGMVIAAVVAKMGVAPDNDAIGWTRENYCRKAVENDKQENYLVMNFRCAPPPKRVHYKKGRGSY